MPQTLGAFGVAWGLCHWAGVQGRDTDSGPSRRLDTAYGRTGARNYGDFQQTANVFSTAYAFMALDFNSGTAKCWGRSELGGSYNYGGKCDETEGAFAGFDRVYGGFNAFVLISSSSGRGLCSGHPEEGCRGFDSAEGAFHGYSEVFSNNYAMLALNTELGTAKCWGRAAFGGQCDFPPGSLSGYTQVLSTASAFFMINPETGSAKCWGEWEGGTPVSCDETPGVLRGFTDIMATTLYAVAFFDAEEGTMKCWGLEDWGGACNTTRGHFLGFTELFSNGGVFLALDRSRGSMKCWGGHGRGVPCDETPGAFQGYTRFFSTASAFMALNPVSGTARCWGYSEPGTMWDGGGVCNETAGHFLGFSTVMASSNAFVALNPNSGTLRCWGAVYSRGVACNEAEGAFTGFTELYSTLFAFMVLNPSTGAAQCWGSPSEGGLCDHREGSLTRFLKRPGAEVTTTVLGSIDAGTGLATTALKDAPVDTTTVFASSGAGAGAGLTTTTVLDAPTTTSRGVEMSRPLGLISGAHRGHSLGLLTTLPWLCAAATLICCLCGYSSGLMYATVRLHMTRVRLNTVGPEAALVHVDSSGVELPFASLVDE